MANITLSETPGSAVFLCDKTKELVQTTATPFITPNFSSLDRVAGPAYSSRNFNIGDLDSPGTGTRKTERGFLRGRRPYFGLLFPRGYYNR
jgi:hypothetical protein